MPVIIKIDNLSKNYGTKKNLIKALGPISLEINKSDFVVILGRSGSGKSTLLNLMAGLDTPTEGRIVVSHQNITHSKSGTLAKYRSKIGIIFQFYNLLPNLNVVENIQMGAWVAGNSVDSKYLDKLLEQFGLTHRRGANVKTLSGGEKQRVAIARALINKPTILFCDEPTGALDTTNEKQVELILKELNNEGLTIVMVTHNPEFSDLANQVITMKDGLIISNILKTVEINKSN